tara:strand:+ start:563 stop:721 length:159 start_codon:yes stop_codon:yes gene_type:complete
MELPINQKDLNTIISALALGGDARLYHLLKNFQRDIELKNTNYQYEQGTCDI